MSNFSLLEWLLARLSSRQRAAEVVGDCLEQGLTSNELWRVVSRLASALLVRRVIEIAFATASAVSVVLLYCLYVVPKWKLPHHESWAIWSVRLGAVALCLGINAGLTASHNGMRDRLTRISVFVWLTVTACTCVTWLPNAIFGIAAVFMVGTIILLWTRDTRNTFLCAIASTLALATTFAIFFLFSRLTLIPNTGRVGLANIGFSFAAYLSSLLVARITTSLVRPRLLNQ